MDRIISLLAALVGLIALGGAVLVHVNADSQRAELAAEIAAIRAGMGSSMPPSETIAVADPAPASVASSAPSSAESPSAESSAVEAGAPTIDSLQRRISELEEINRTQASQLIEVEAELAAQSPAPSQPAAASGASQASSSAIAADGPTKDCIPLGTRFMGQAGDRFPICKSKAVVKVSEVDDGAVVIDGAGAVAAGSFGNLAAQGCTVMVFSADTTGFAEMRVTCQ